MPPLDTITTILRAALGLGSAPLAHDTALLGSLPELDSMAVISVIAALEEHFGFAIEDDEIHARHFATVGTLQAFVDAKLAQADVR